MRPAQILVLAIALGAAGLAVLLVGRSEPPPVEAPAPMPTATVLVAKTDIALGQSLGPDQLDWVAWPVESARGEVIRQGERPNALTELTGAIARASFVAGEPIRDAKIIKSNGSGFLAAILPGGMRAVAVEISPETGAGGFILPNDRVDVIFTRRQRDSDRRDTPEEPPSETILNNVRVLAIDQSIEEKNGQRVVIGKTATLEVTALEGERLTQARQNGTLSLALRSLADANAKREQLDDRDGRQEVNMVRFGVSSPTAVTTAPK